jgi:hypothetical protein
MPDWNALVRERLPKAGLSSAQHEEIVAELAGHLEEFYEHQHEQGACDESAFKTALAQIDNWRDLAHKIRRAKRKDNEMNQRTKTFWLPGMISLLAACAFMAIIVRFIEQPRILASHPQLMLVLYPAWLAVQPILGAIGAYSSRRAGGTRLARVTASLFPSIAFVGMLLAILAANMIQRTLHVRYDVLSGVMLAKVVFVGMVVPALALLLGALPFLRSPQSEVAAGN